jgi:hypothetical protein
MTCAVLDRDGVPFTLVVEPQDEAAYRERMRGWMHASLVTLPENDRGLIYARNTIKDRSREMGDVRHWQLDDNIKWFQTWRAGKRVRCHSGVALRACEDFTDRYSNVGVSGLNYKFFATNGREPKPHPFAVNTYVYSCSLVLNALPYRWRSPYNDDTDFCLQVLSGGWCTVLLHAFHINKIETMLTAGGNTPIYQDDGRLVMARSLERLWPGVVRVSRRFGRPQHVINWQKFRQPLIRKLDAVPAPDYRLRLVEKSPPKSARLRAMLENQ